jgi:hypothetical protein
LARRQASNPTAGTIKAKVEGSGMSLPSGRVCLEKPPEEFGINSYAEIESVMRPPSLPVARKEFGSKRIVE